MSAQPIDFSKYEATAPPAIDFSKYEGQASPPPPSAASRLGSNFLSGAGVVSNEQGKNFFIHPVDALKAMADQQGALGERAGKELANKDYVRGLTHGVEWLIPGLGPILAKSGDQLENKDYAGGTGTALGAAANILAAHQAPGAINAAVDAAPAVAGAVGDVGAAAVRGTAKGVNTALAKAPGTIGAAVGGAVGHATGLPYAGEIGAGIGTVVGKEVLPKIQIRGENFGLPKPVFPGAPLPEHPGTFPGAPLPGTPLPEQINPSLISPARTIPGQIAPEQIAPPAPSGAAPIPPRSGLALPSAPLGAELADLPKTEAASAAQSGEALGGIKPLAELPPKAVHQAVGELGPNASIAALTDRANKIAKLGDLLNEGMGGRPLQPNVSLRNQAPSGPAPANSLPEGMTPVDSSALKGYKYDPNTREFESMTTSGAHYIHGDVSPEQAAAFEAEDSKGKAWNDLRNSSTLVAKVVNGKRVAVKPPSELQSSDPNNLTPQLEEMLRQALVKKQQPMSQ